MVLSEFYHTIQIDWTLSISDFILIFIGGLSVWIAYEVRQVTKRQYESIREKEKDEYEWYIIDKLSDMQAMCSWINSFLEENLYQPETYPNRVDERIKELEEKLSKVSIISKDETINFLNYYRLVRVILENPPWLTDEIRIKYLRSILDILKQTLIRYDDYFE